MRCHNSNTGKVMVISMKRWMGCIGVLLMLLLWGMPHSVSRAGSGMIQFTLSNGEVIKGEEVTVVCQVFSSQGFLDASFEVRYDERYLEFIRGGTKVSGGDGVLRISSVGNSEMTEKKTFSLQFRGKKTGTAVVGVKDRAQIITEEGEELSISSNSVTVDVVKKSEHGQKSVEKEEKTQKTLLKKKDKKKKKKDYIEITATPIYTYYPEMEEVTMLPQSQTNQKEETDAKKGNREFSVIPLIIMGIVGILIPPPPGIGKKR